ncbi:MAG TPA: ABC transporter substrate-binding protein [Methylomirabilota bacterium]|nr:ABC transporter substrate-binding protein [Methylomirabilota bacterium]
MGCLTIGLTLAVLLLSCPLAGRAAAGPATDQVHGSIDNVLKILADPELKKASRAPERRRAIRTVANEIFDFDEISRRSLAVHWRARTPDERREFVDLFGDLLENSYVSKIEMYSGEKILYTGETADGDLAVVKTRIVTKQGTEVPVDYRMFKQGPRWRAYDVNIEGVSLVANYRAQFNTIISRSGYPDLVSKLRAKRDERPGARDVGRPEEPTPTPPSGSPHGRQGP